MPITDKQRTERSQYIGGSDARKLMSGAWLEVWQEKTARRQPEDLSQNVLVQIGIATEALHPQFYALKTGRRVVEVPDTQRSFDHAYIAANLDFATYSAASGDTWDIPIEAKFNAGFATLEDSLEYNFWQIQHQLLVTGCDEAVLSLIQPRRDGYSFATVGRDAGRIQQLLETIHAFWWYVENDEPPGQAEFVAAPTVARQKVLDMSLNNSFVNLASIVLEHRDAVKASKDAESEVKATMPEDAQLCYLPARDGKPGFLLSRDKAGKISMKFGDLPKTHARRSTLWFPDSVPTTEAGE